MKVFVPLEPKPNLSSIRLVRKLNLFFLKLTYRYIKKKRTTHNILIIIMFRTHTKVGQKIGGFFRTFPKTLIWLRFGRYGTLHMYFVPYMTNSAKSLIHTISCRYEKSTKAVRKVFWVSVPKFFLICLDRPKNF